MRGWVVWITALVASAVLFARCSPEDSARAVKRFQEQLQAVLEPLQRRAQVGVLVADGMGRQYFRLGAESLLVPASTLKLFWSAAVLAVLGDTATVRTRLFAEAAPDAHGVIRGNLYLVGGGDPLLGVQDLEELAAFLVRRGVRRITGSVVADGSLFDRQRDRLVYSGDRDVVEPLPPITALGLERNSVRVLVSVVRGRAVAQTVPVSPAFVVDVSGVRVGKRYRRRGVWLQAQSRMQGKVQQIVVRGHVADAGLWSLEVPIMQPELAAAATLWQRLKAAGIVVEGGFAEGICPRTAVLLAERERPVLELLARVNKESDNVVAEHLFKLLGATAAGEGSDADKARRLLQGLLARWGIPCQGCQFRDGSGLSRQNRVSAADLVALLVSLSQTPFAESFRQSLAVAGIDGTLRRRLQSSEAYGRVWAKTGTLRNASALAGYALTADGSPLVFALLSFGAIRNAKAVEDSVVALMARFSFCSDAAQSR